MMTPEAFDEELREMILSIYIRPHMHARKPGVKLVFFVFLTPEKKPSLTPRPPKVLNEGGEIIDIKAKKGWLPKLPGYPVAGYEHGPFRGHVGHFADGMFSDPAHTSGINFEQWKRLLAKEAMIPYHEFDDYFEIIWDVPIPPDMY